jgi:hypothetical protein
MNANVWHINGISISTSHIEFYLEETSFTTLLFVGETEVHCADLGVGVVKTEVRSIKEGSIILTCNCS